MILRVLTLCYLCFVATASAQDWISRNGGSIGGGHHSAQQGRPSPTPTPPLTVADAQQEAIRQHPDLGVQGSPFNQEFVDRFRRYQQERPTFFNDARWPMRLADEVATIVTEKRPGPAKYDSASFLGLTEAQVIARLGKPEAIDSYPSPDGSFKMLKYGGQPGQETFFTIFASDGVVSDGQYRGAPFRSR